MRMIDQKIFLNLTIEIEDNGEIMQISDFNGDCIDIDKQGAKQLIEILKEFVNENQ